MSKTRIIIAIPDAGPLISLAKADALDLLLVFKDRVKIVITDVVHHEVTHNPVDYPDATKIRDFLSRHSDQVLVEKTTYGDLVLFRMQNDPGWDFPPDAGELSIQSYVVNLVDRPPGPPVLVITEDQWFEKHSGTTPGNIHLVSTSAYLKALYKMFNIQSAGVVLKKLFNMGRANYEIDRPATKIKPDTDWTLEIDEESGSSLRS